MCPLYGRILLILSKKVHWNGNLWKILFLFRLIKGITPTICNIFVMWLKGECEVIMDLYGENVKLRAIEEEDIEMLRQMKNDPWMESMVVGWCKPLSKANQKKWFDSLSSTDTGRFLYIIESKNGNSIGYICLTEIDWKNRSAFVGIMIDGKKNMGKGFATDAYTTLIDYAFNELNINRLEAHILDYNTISQRVLIDKIGFEKEGVRRKAIYKNGKYHDLIIAGLLKDEYIHKQNDYE